MRRSSPARPGLHGRLLLSVLTTIGLVLAGLTAGFNIVLADRLNGEATGVVQARAAAELAAIDVSRNHIVLPEAPDQGSPDSLVWVFQGSRPLEQPRSEAPAGATANSIAQRAPATTDDPSSHIRLVAIPVAVGGRRIGAVVAGVSLAPYDQSRRTALIGSIVLALAALVAVGLAARWMIARALRPVARMTLQASEWSEHDLERRFSQGPPRDEITQLAFTLDGLLERLAASLRHEQRLSGELSHELRTPLANVAAEAQYALRHTAQTADGRAALEHVLESARRMGLTLDTLIAAARGRLDPHRATSDAGACARAAASADRPLDPERAVNVTVAAPSAPVRVAVEQQLVERILAPVLENAFHYATERVQLIVTEDENAVVFTIEDDGPGVRSEDHETIFRPGRRLARQNHGTATAHGAGLGLALSRRLAQTAGGDVIADQCPSGARFISAHSNRNCGVMSLKLRKSTGFTM